jgi:hypothetical protein
MGHNRDVDITVNSDPIKARFIVVTLPDLSADKEQEFVLQADAERACSEVGSAVNRWLYEQCNSEDN